MKALVIPSCFFHDGQANFSEQRSKISQWMVFIESRRDVLRTALNRIWVWRLAGFIADGLLKLPRGWTIDDLKWEWVGPGFPSISPVDDAKAACMRIAAGITSPQRVCKEVGEDSGEILKELAAWNVSRQALGLPPPLYGIAGVPQAEAIIDTQIQQRPIKHRAEGE